MALQITEDMITAAMDDAAIHTWINQQPPDAVIGLARTTYACPVATCLRAILGLTGTAWTLNVVPSSAVPLADRAAYLRGYVKVHDRSRQGTQPTLVPLSRLCNNLANHIDEHSRDRQPIQALYLRLILDEWARAQKETEEDAHQSPTHEG